MTPDDFERAGLYDPQSPDAEDRLALLQWLAEKGATIKAMVSADRAGGLNGLGGRLQLRPRIDVSLRDIATRTGMPVETIQSFYLALGMPPVAADVPVLNEEEAAMFGNLPGGISIMGEAGMRRLMQTTSVAMAAIAEAASAKVIANSRGGTGLEQAKASARATSTLGGFEKLLALTMRLHMDLAGQRLRRAEQATARSPSYRFAVGFVDLSGFTTLSRTISYDDLDGLVERFETIANDVANTRGGRVVKFIGDEVMFVSDSVVVTCGIALTLLEKFAGDPQLKPRAGIAYGDLLVHGGDYFGPVVNLASRLAELAVRGEVLVTEEAANACDGAGLRFDPAGRRMVRGFDEPMTVLNVTCSA